MQVVVDRSSLLTQTSPFAQSRRVHVAARLYRLRPAAGPRPPVAGAARHGILQEPARACRRTARSRADARHHVRGPDRDRRSPAHRACRPADRRRALLAACIAAAGHGLVAWQLGDDDAIRAGLESDARRHVAHLITDLQRMAATLARHPDVRAGLRDELESPRRLFAANDTLSIRRRTARR
jgi:hypothetical protein